jgi:peptide deformylase
MDVEKIRLIYGPAAVFRIPIPAVTEAEFNEELEQVVEKMFDILYTHDAVGLAGNMVGLLKQVVVMDLQEEGVKAPLTLINPRLVSRSGIFQTFLEGSISFPSVSARIARDNAVTILYQDVKGEKHTKEFKGWAAQVIIHEMDYFECRLFVDYLPQQQRKSLFKKYKAYMLKEGNRFDPDAREF